MREPVVFTSKVQNQVLYGPGGIEIRFSGGEYPTSSAREIKYLRNHPMYGARIKEVGAEAEASVQGLKEAAVVDETPVLIEFPCGAPGCNYVSRNADPAKAKTNLNRHRSRMKHEAS